MPTQARSAYVGRLRDLAASQLQHHDANGDGVLSLAEARQLSRYAAQLHSKDPRQPAALDRATFSAVCSDPARGLTCADLVSLLDVGGGSLKSTLPRTCLTKVPKGQTPHLRSSGSATARQGVRAEERIAQARLGAIGDTLALGSIVRAVRHVDVETLADLLLQNSLCLNPNPYVLDEGIQQALGTQTSRFPLLWIACLIGNLLIFDLVASEIAKHARLEDALLLDVEGWLLPSVIGLRATTANEASIALHHFFNLLDSAESRNGPILRRCLLREDALDEAGKRPRRSLLDLDTGTANELVQPLQVLLGRGEEVWPGFWTILVKRGGGIPHDLPTELTSPIGSCLAAGGHLGAFLDACAAGGDTLQPGTSTFAGLFVGLLDSRLQPERAREALASMLEAGLRVDKPLTFGGLWPLHTAARRDCVTIVKALLTSRACSYAVNSRNLTPLDVALSARSEAAAVVLRAAAGSRVHSRSGFSKRSITSPKTCW